MSATHDRPPPDGPAGDLIRRLSLTPHPEGGWYRETWRAPGSSGIRAASTAILFLLPQGEVSRWHKVDADEIWLHHAGGPLALAVTGLGRMEMVQLGSDIAAGETPQAIAPANCWQAAKPLGAFTLVSCVVAPGFAFAGFTLAEPDWAPRGAEDFLPKE